jgi:hypothetical protein
MNDNKNLIIELDLKRMHAMISQDVIALNSVLSDQLVYTHSSARIDSKETLIKSMQQGKTIYTSIVPSDVIAQDFGNVVILTGIASICVNSNSVEMDFKVRFTDVYALNVNKWQMIVWQSTKIPN